MAVHRRNRVWSALAALGLGTLVTLATAAEAGARDDDDAADVRPVLECVSVNGDGSYTAVFGTQNDGRSTENIPIGTRNRISPSPTNRGQPTQIRAGRSVGTFSVTFPASGSITWNLAGSAASATQQSRACSTAPVVSEAAVSVVLALVAGAVGFLWWLRRPDGGNGGVGGDGRGASPLPTAP